MSAALYCVVVKVKCSKNFHTGYVKMLIKMLAMLVVIPNKVYVVEVGEESQC